MQYGDIPLERLYIVRSMSFDEFKGVVATDDGVCFSAQTNEQKASRGQNGALLMHELGFSGKELNSRNTVHFCLNTLVEDHVNGAFSRQVIAIAPLALNLAPSGPSSFAEIDIAFPFRSGERTFKSMNFLVSEEYAGAAAAHANTHPNVPAFEVMQGIKAADATNRYLAARGAPLKEAGWYAWRDSPNTEERHRQAREFSEAMSEQCGHLIPAQIHAGALESHCEAVLAKFLESCSELFQGRPLYFEMDGDREHLERLKLLTAQLQLCDVRHPDTRAYIQKLLPVLKANVATAQEFSDCLSRYRQGNASDVDRMFLLAPACFQSGLESELAAFKEENPIFPPPLPAMEFVASPVG